MNVLNRFGGLAVLFFFLRPNYNLCLQLPDNFMHVYQNMNFSGLFIRDQNVFRLIPDNSTLAALGLGNADRRYTGVKPFKFGREVSRITTTPSFDKKILKLFKNEKFVRNVRNLRLNLCNAAFILLRNQLTFCSRNRSYSPQLDLTTDRVMCAPFTSANTTSFVLFQDTKEAVFGEDPRAIINRNKIELTFNYCNISVWPSRFMLTAKLNYDPYQGQTDIHIHHADIRGMIPEHAPYSEQKNWTPFTYNETLYFIYSINPHQILHLFENASSVPTTHPHPYIRTLSIAELVATSHVSDLHWSYGELRGGTPASLIDGVYLSFFHSRRVGPSSGRYTYFMGAYTFAAKPPFQILAISPKPIVVKAFYQGRYRSSTFDYIVFPTSYMVDLQWIYLYVGYQDREMWKVVLNRTALLGSLSRVRSQVIGSSSWKTVSYHSSRRDGEVFESNRSTFAHHRPVHKSYRLCI